MNAMLLAAGLGLRMRPLTQDRPKPALSVLGRPLAIQNLQRMRDASIEHAVLNLHYCPDALRAILGEGGQGGMPRVSYTIEDPILGTGGGLRNARDLLIGDGPILAHNADFLSDVDFAAMRDTHDSGDQLATLALAPSREGYSKVDIDHEGRIVSLAGLPEVDPKSVAGSFLFTGCHLLDDSVLDRLPATGPSNIIDTYRELAVERRLGAYLHPGFWWEFGTPRCFLDGHLALLDLDEATRSGIGDHDPVREVAGCPLVSTGPGVELDAGVVLSGRCSLAMAARIGEGSRLEDSVVLEESWIGPRGRLRRVIVGPHTELPAGFEARDAVVCPDLTPDRDPGEGVERHAGLLIRPLAG
ncbi:MAG: NTP transferase domain-containing protein [Acidobacteria bacterium]|nr:NTP transferase domain-containing protein [Acidobacteriota bacterium]NIM62770.1 NTP transferase domain-containing protein [Acidobacteriota bacterium]NIO59070.1 NTP transferase domain-containing protein [Acidobacteriota bacterium]NIQ30109.1 NTP transferase domain-containing protein [Acidobacteriota bacterium]NIQ84912.1 NTP transferase domain-containing protein [Acidobacteriota bacterium]